MALTQLCGCGSQPCARIPDSYPTSYSHAALSNVLTLVIPLLLNLISGSRFPTR